MDCHGGHTWFLLKSLSLCKDCGFCNNCCGGSLERVGRRSQGVKESQSGIFQRMGCQLWLGKFLEIWWGGTYRGWDLRREGASVVASAIESTLQSAGGGVENFSSLDSCIWKCAGRGLLAIAL